MAGDGKAGDIGELRKELAAIKGERLREELEDIRRSRLREELEDIKAERAQGRQHGAAPGPRLSIPTAFMAVATLIVAGFILGAAYPVGLPDAAAGILASLAIPVTAPAFLAMASGVLAVVGIGFAAMAKR